jgi:hypothetical protein
MTLADNEQAFRRWLREARPGAERPYPDGIEALASRAAAGHLVARGWNNRVGRYAVRLHHRIGQGLDDEPRDHET